MCGACNRIVFLLTSHLDDSSNVQYVDTPSNTLSYRRGAHPQSPEQCGAPASVTSSPFAYDRLLTLPPRQGLHSRLEAVFRIQRDRHNALSMPVYKERQTQKG
jgi:hypothetical protein